MESLITYEEFKSDKYRSRHSDAYNRSQYEIFKRHYERSLLVNEFQEHFKQQTGGPKEQQNSNWVDFYLWSIGWRIRFAGGVIPERFWSNGQNEIVVRYNEIDGLGSLPMHERDLEQYIKTGKYWKEQS